MYEKNPLNQKIGWRLLAQFFRGVRSLTETLAWFAGEHKPAEQRNAQIFSKVQKDGDASTK
jgi:hypothetical protein